MFPGSTRLARDVDSVALKQAALKVIALGGAPADLAMQVIDLLPLPRELPLARSLVLRGGERAQQLGLGLRLPVPDRVGVEVVLGCNLVDGLGALQCLEHRPRLELGGGGLPLGRVNLALRAFPGALCGFTPEC